MAHSIVLGIKLDKTHTHTHICVYLYETTVSKYRFSVFTVSLRLPFLCISSFPSSSSSCCFPSTSSSSFATWFGRAFFSLLVLYLLVGCVLLLLVIVDHPIPVIPMYYIRCAVTFFLRYNFCDCVSVCTDITRSNAPAIGFVPFYV